MTKRETDVGQVEVGEERVFCIRPLRPLRRVNIKKKSDIKSDAHLNFSCHQRFNQMITEMEYALSSSLVVHSLESKAELGGKWSVNPLKLHSKFCVFVIFSEERALEFNTQRRSQGTITHSQNK